MINFYLEYHTTWGENLCLHVREYCRQELITDQVLTMTTPNGVLWNYTLFNSSRATHILYYYMVKNGNEVVREEWHNEWRMVELASKSQNASCYDFWNDIPEHAFLYSSAFTRGFSPRVLRKEISFFKQTLVLTVMTPFLKSNESLAIAGNHAVFGNWDPRNALVMMAYPFNVWRISIDTTYLPQGVEFKFIIVDKDSSELVQWEEGENRVLTFPQSMQDENVWLTLSAPRFNILPWRGAGCVIPVFSLRTKQSFGIGDFGDLKTMVDWIAMTGQRMLQILPINDTTKCNNWLDSYPYNSISIYAFHPIYINLNALPKLKDETALAVFERKRKKLNALPKVDYEAVMMAKKSYLHLLFEQCGNEYLQSDGYKKFYDANAQWLLPYAAFSFLRDKYGTADFKSWETHSVYNQQEINQLISKRGKAYGDIRFYCFLQYILHVQLLEASNYARSKGVVIKGDIPIGISPDSVEAWVEPHYFNMNGQAGAPPDAFSANGQNWGFPTYNWEVMENDGCQWWKRRFRKMSEYFDAYRIDHVLGFFRIWEIPKHSVYGLLGQFSPALPMTAAEIEQYGIKFERAKCLKPYITDKILEKVFGENASVVKKQFVREVGTRRYELLPEFDTQRKVQQYVASHEELEDLKEGLYRLISNVLFVPDRVKEDAYHPRIMAFDDLVFESLTEQEQQAFRWLHDDYYYNRHNQFWYKEAMKKLPIITYATNMLVCAEDLGMVPQCVPWVMNDLRILTLEIQTMPKGMDGEFANLKNNPYRSVATIFTHDMPTLRGWWEEDAERTQRYYNHSMQHEGSAPKVLNGKLAAEVIKAHLDSPSLLCLLSFQDWMSMDEQLRFPFPEEERINVPSNPRNYWQYRMHIDIEDLMKETAFNDKLRTMIAESGRLN